MATIDFAAIKDAVPIDNLVDYLALKGMWRGDQWRGQCPSCKGNDRSLVVTKGKGFYCWDTKKGGDAIALVAHVKGISQPEAAKLIQEHYRVGSSPTTSQGPAKAGFDLDKYLAGLDPEHAALGPLGIDPEVLRGRQGGYASSGALRGYLALPATRDGKIVAFFGRSLDGSPTLKFINGFEPQDFIFGEDRVTEGTLTLCKDVIDVIKAQEAGVNAVAFLSECVSAVQLQILASLMDAKKVEVLEIL